MKTSLLIIFSLLINFCLVLAQGKLHPWTDAQGRTLQAYFIKSDGVTLTLNWNGNEVPIPLATLSAESQALAQKLSAPPPSSVPSNPFDTVAPSADVEKLHAWTDNQGRTLNAIFIKADATSVTVKWNGKIVPLPLVNLSPDSQKLARSLSGATVSTPKPVASMPKK